MQIQVNTDDNVEGCNELAHRIEVEINNTLGRFSDQITRIEVHLSDENAGKSGGADKRCLMEARLAGRQPDVAAAVNVGYLSAGQDGSMWSAAIT